MLEHARLCHILYVCHISSYFIFSQVFFDMKLYYITYYIVLYRIICYYIIFLILCYIVLYYDKI